MSEPSDSSAASRPRRQSKPVEAYNPLDYEKPILEFLIEEGEGSVLSTIDHVNKSVKKHTGASPVIKLAHAVCYPTQARATKASAKQHILAFSGYPTNQTKDLTDAARLKLEKAHLPEIRELADIFGLHVSGTKAQLEDRILEFLAKPHEIEEKSKKRAASDTEDAEASPKKKAKTTSTKKETSESKSNKSSKKKSDAEKAPYTPNSYMIFCAERRANRTEDEKKMTVAELGKKMGEEWRALSQEEKDAFKVKQQAAAAAVPKQEPKAKSAKPAKSKAAKKADKEEGEEAKPADDEAEPTEEEKPMYEKVQAAVTDFFGSLSPSSGATLTKGAVKAHIRSKVEDADKLLVRFKNRINGLIQTQFQKHLGGQTEAPSKESAAEASTTTTTTETTTTVHLA